MHRSGLLLLMPLVLVIASCGGSSSPSQAAAVPTEAAPGQAPGDAGGAQAGGGSTQAVTIAEATYTSGLAHVEVSGEKQLALDGQLVAGASMTAAGTTLLLYATGEGENASVFSISNGADTGLAFTITAPGIVAGGDGTSGCAIELTKNDGSGIEGHFDCSSLTTVGLDQATINVRATFSAAN